MQATIHGRGQTGYIEIGFKKDGTITGFRYNVFADMGSYFQLLTPAIPTLTGLMLSGCYKIPAIQMNVTGMFTNKMSTDAYRGAGRPEATYVIERALDLVARSWAWIRSKCDVKIFRSRMNFLSRPRLAFSTTAAIIKARWIKR